MSIIRCPSRSRTIRDRNTSSFIHAEAGAVLPLIGLTMLVICLIMGIALDLGRMYLVRYKALAALDSALLGAADIATRARWEDNPEEVRARARQFFRANFPTGYLGSNISDADIRIEYDADTGLTTGDVRVDIPYVFGGIYRLAGGGTQGTTFSAPVDSQVQRAAGAALEVALVMDYSFSMCFRQGTGDGWGTDAQVDMSCPKFRALETGVRNFVETIQDSVSTTSTTSGDQYKAHFAFIPFTHTNNVNGVIPNQLYCDEENINKLPMTRGLTSTRETVDGYLSELFPPSLPSEGGTNSAHGFWWGWSALRNNSDDIARFTGDSAHENGYIPADQTRVEALTASKVLLLMTDGFNQYPNFRCDQDDDVLSINNGGMYRDETANTRLATMCEDAKKEGIRVITILYDVQEDSDIDRILRTCASKNSSFRATDSEELLIIFEDIARQLIDLRITR